MVKEWLVARSRAYTDFGRWECISLSVYGKFKQNYKDLFFSLLRCKFFFFLVHLYLWDTFSIYTWYSILESLNTLKYFNQIPEGKVFSREVPQTRATCQSGRQSAAPRLRALAPVPHCLQQLLTATPRMPCLALNAANAPSSSQFS